ncbi:isopropylmalate isomerase [Marinobacter sp. AL4B]|uniref:isopropylmalate isomerase n=1 Tax=Marinobacter sp. AL4B TaxID=2871173 RepID=UPI001CAA6023|nr:isopropylmalate isomerase [Marinobacter sp. AL4B]MBZ0333009.1 isopropylmalate isomerase [Marinobacter sp. AL4B]
MRVNGENRSSFIEVLSGTPEACGLYRRGYVRGFRENVKALAAEDTEAQKRAQKWLSDNRREIEGKGLIEADCSRPFCIIEPLQNGQLDTWCGYRLEADEGSDLYQWLDWETVQAALQRSKQGQQHGTKNAL